MGNDSKIALAQDSFQKGYISKAELAGILHQEGEISDQEMSGMASEKPSMPGPMKMLGMANRAYSGAGAGIQQLLTGGGQTGAAAALMQRMAGGQPKPGERVGATLGDLASPTSIAANYLLPGGTAAKSVLGGALMGGGSSAMNQAENGNVSLPETAMSAGLGGAIGLGAHGLSTVATDFLESSPALLENVMKIPKKATEMFRGNPRIMQGAPESAGAVEANLEKKATGVHEGLRGIYRKAKDIYRGAAKESGVVNTPKELAKMQPISPQNIPEAVESAQRRISESAEGGTDAERYLKYLKMGLSEKDINKRMASPSTGEEVNHLKTLLHIRQSIGHWVDKKGADVFGPVEAGLSAYRKQVNELIERLPGGDIIRNADHHTEELYAMFNELKDSLKTPGKTLKYVREAFEGTDLESKEKMMKLLALEKLTGKPIVQDMLRALTQSHFAEPLAGHTVRRSILGISPFLMSAAMRTVGVPFQASLPIAAAFSTAGQSPWLAGKAIRAAQKLEPYVRGAGKATAVAGLTALRRMSERGQ